MAMPPSEGAIVRLTLSGAEKNPGQPSHKDERHAQEKLYAAASLLGGGFRPERAEGQLPEASGEGFHRSSNTGRSLLCHPTFCLGDATTS